MTQLIKVIPKNNRNLSVCGNRMDKTDLGVISSSFSVLSLDIRLIFESN